MTIRINQIAVDFTLEKERTMADLTTSLRAWATGQNLAVLGILADGRALGPEDTTPLDQVGSVEVEAVPAGERDLARVAVISRFFSLLAQGWERDAQDLVGELRREYPSVRGALFPLLSPLASRLQPALAVLDGPWVDPAALIQAARTVAREAEALRRELQDPRAALEATLAHLDGFLPGLERLPGLFQRGQDKQGFETILALFTLLEDLGRQADRALRFHEADPSGWSSFQQELQPFLKEAEGALATGDLILLTDLIEYEVSPRLKQAREQIPPMDKLDPVPDLL